MRWREIDLTYHSSQSHRTQRQHINTFDGVLQIYSRTVHDRATINTMHIIIYHMTAYGHIRTHAQLVPIDAHVCDSACECQRTSERRCVCVRKSGWVCSGKIITFSYIFAFKWFERWVCVVECAIAATTMLLLAASCAAETETNRIALWTDTFGDVRRDFIAATY